MDDHTMRLPTAPRPRGPLSRWVLDQLQGRAGGRRPSRPPAHKAGFGADVQLALYLCYEGHFGPVPGAVGDREWSPELIDFRRSLEASFEAALRSAVSEGTSPGSFAGLPVEAAIPAIIAADDGPSLSRHMEQHGTIEQMRDFVMRRSAYQLKEGDAHTLGVPRLRGRAKQILMEIQAGEYGADAPDRCMHSELFAQTMRSLGMDDRPNAYLDQLPASALMISNLISMFGLNRRWRGALVGHLAVFEMTSVTPMGRYARGLERMGASADARRFYDVHVLADADHEVMALEMARSFVAVEPELRADVLFGASCVNVVEGQFASSLLRGWRCLAPTGVAA